MGGCWKAYRASVVAAVARQVRAAQEGRRETCAEGAARGAGEGRLSSHLLGVRRAATRSLLRMAREEVRDDHLAGNHRCGASGDRRPTGIADPPGEGAQFGVSASSVRDRGRGGAHIVGARRRRIKQIRPAACGTPRAPGSPRRCRGSSGSALSADFLERGVHLGVRDQPGPASADVLFRQLDRRSHLRPEVAQVFERGHIEAIVGVILDRQVQRAGSNHGESMPVGLYRC
jgi:hypothetical protein